MKYSFRNIVFEGGGIKCICYGGALMEFEKMGMLSGVERVAGASAGAITACLLSLKYTPEEISYIIAETDFKKFEDNTFFVIRDIIRLMRQFGWNKGDVFKSWIGKLIENKTGNERSTFADLKLNGYIDLYVVCTNITRQTTEVLSYETTPNLAVADAIRMSMSIPVYFAAVKNENGDIIVDGGVTWNYPINIFDNIKYISNKSNGISVDYNLEPDYVFNYETLGFKVDSKQEIVFAENNWKTPEKKVISMKKFIGALMNFTMEMVNKKHLHKNDWNRTIFIDSLDVATTDFKLSEDKVNKLIDNGKIGVENYFKWRNNDLILSKIPKH